jgi:hypothetical protein
LALRGAGPAGPSLLALGGTGLDTLGPLRSRAFNPALLTLDRRPLHTLDRRLLRAFGAWWTLRPLRTLRALVALLGELRPAATLPWPGACRGGDRHGGDARGEYQPGHHKTPFERQQRRIRRAVPLPAGL